MLTLREELWEPWLKDFLATQNVTEELLVIVEAPQRLAKLVNLVNKEELHNAIDKTAFDKLPAAIQLLFYARIGQVFLAAMWSAVRDVNAPDSDPPATLADIMAMVENQLPESLRQHEQANG
jgi:hypothetical protein